MNLKDRELLDAARSVAGKLGGMSAALEGEASMSPGTRASANLTAAGVLVALGNLIDAICDEIEARTE